MKLRLGVVTDLHWTNKRRERLGWHNAFDVEGVPMRLHAALDLFRVRKCDVVVCLGDVTHYGDSSALDYLRTIWRIGWEGPLVFVAGNHDAEGTLMAFEEELLEHRPEPDYRFARVELDRRSAVRGRLQAPALEERPAVRVVLSHYPLLSRRRRLEESKLAFAGDLANREFLERELTEDPTPTVILCGHLHCRDSFATGWILQLAFGAVVEEPFECAIVDISTHDSDVSVSRDCRPLTEARSASTVPVLAPLRERWIYTDGSWAAAVASSGTGRA